ncbi:hypothetical protein BD413DRAFT_469890 [Trametes elegans]|nr:hypothetical protein BD413DRAFT_469890 [Trametes elegans]
MRLSSSPALLEEDGFGSAPLLGIYADVNMRERAFQEQTPSICVSPADIMGGDSLDNTMSSAEPLVTSIAHISRSEETASPAADNMSSGALDSSDRHLSLTPDYTQTADFPDKALVEGDFPEDAISAIVSVLKSSTKQEVVELESVPPGAQAHEQGTVKPSELEVVAPRPLYPTIPSYPGNNLGLHHPTAANPADPPPAPDTCQPLCAPPSAMLPPPLAPVLNAHTGIELEELRQRATDFRMRMPDAELDRSFLQSFAGRLSARGELLDEYRCYVVGCGQRNKRRDHILVHVGSHVEHRPWRCQHCGMRFLRKNECKRHESSHEGLKPFACPVCAPHQERCFVRQDLLKRHMRVSHGIHDTSRLSMTRKRGGVKKGEYEECWT